MIYRIDDGMYGKAQVRYSEQNTSRHVCVDKKCVYSWLRALIYYTLCCDNLPFFVPLMCFFFSNQSWWKCTHAAGIIWTPVFAHARDRPLKSTCLFDWGTECSEKHTQDPRNAKSWVNKVRRCCREYRRVYKRKRAVVWRAPIFRNIIEGKTLKSF